ncbi:hypothetical protein PAHAL_1G426400 [Panicum hallii]|uniref:Uncharacterized protein n=1 Tax=Panicum hallii TaxID=206008 RepID=A0A2S3GTY6_9POAL|nr:hypothetical protein PAHAL_1G426400 [Panicum hallii]
MEQIRVGRRGPGADGELGRLRWRRREGWRPSGDSAITGSGVVNSGAATLIWVSENRMVQRRSQIRGSLAVFAELK